MVYPFYNYIIVQYFVRIPKTTTLLICLRISLRALHFNPLVKYMAYNVTL